MRNQILFNAALTAVLMLMTGTYFVTIATGAVAWVPTLAVLGLGTLATTGAQEIATKLINKYAPQGISA